MRPLVSVLMSVYNNEKYILDSIKSIIKQSYKNIEIIIINDCSDDKSRELIRSFNDSRIKLYDNKKNIGLTKSLNKGIKKCRGKYIARIDADDIMHPKRIEKQVEFMEKKNKVAVLGTALTLIDENNKIIGKRDYPVNKIKRIILRRNPLAHPSVMIRKNMLPKKGYDERLKTAQDYDLWLRINKKNKIANLSEYLLKYRLHEKAIKAKSTFRSHLDTIKIKIKAIKEYGYRPNIIDLLYLLGEILALLIPSGIKRRLYYRMVGSR